MEKTDAIALRKSVPVRARIALHKEVIPVVTDESIPFAPSING